MMQNEVDTAPLPIEHAVARLRRRQQEGEHATALDGAEALLADLPENRDLLMIAASSLRSMSRIAEALAVLDQIDRHHPRYSRALQERGLCHVAHKEAGQAIEALLRAVNINPALPMSWRMLEGVYRLTGDAANAAIAAAHSATLRGLPPEIVTATTFFFDGELAPAEQIVRAYLIEQGDHPEAMRLLAKIGMARDVLDDAELLLDAVVTMLPDHQAARYEYAQCLVQRHKYAAARTQLDRLMARDGPTTTSSQRKLGSQEDISARYSPETPAFAGMTGEGASGLTPCPRNPDYLALAATVAVGLGENERSIALYRELLAAQPGSPDAHLWLGHALKTVGDVPEAVASYRAAAMARPDFGDAYWSLANLKTYRFEEAEIATMRAAEAAAGTATVDRIHLCFALGKALEDRGDTTDSWLYYERGNALQRAESRYRPEILETNTRQQSAVCTPAFFAARRGWGISDPDPIFIVGLPRSGSTLIEQILASHSQVEGTQELADIQRIVLELQGRDPDVNDPLYPNMLPDLAREHVDALGRRYIDDTRAHRTGKAFFIDKMPNNFRHIGLIHLMLPNATIIDARRDPMSCCFSNLKQLFAQGQEFSYSIDDIARYYRTYLDLMAHWEDALPGRVLRIQHEDVIDDLEGNVRRILDHCGLAFEPACVEFHKTRRNVRTPSSEQVRRPIFRDGLDQWKAYEQWLGPLQAALGDAMERYHDA